MTEYWPCLLAAVCAIAVLRCAARQRHGMRSLLAGAVCVLRGRFGIARRDGPADFAAAFIKCLANRAEVCYTLLENEWNIRRRDSPQGLPEESPGFTETE